MTTSAIVGQHLRRWRRDQERSQRFLARLANDQGLGWNQTIVSQIELGHRRVTVEELVALAVVLHEEPCDLLRPVEAPS